MDEKRIKSSEWQPKKYKRRFGDRKEGHKVRNLCPMNKVSPYIMKWRCDAQNYFADSINTANMDLYIRKKRREGLKGFGVMHVFIASYVRMLSQYPGTNRFINAQKIFSRHNIEIMLTVKKSMTLNAPESCVKVDLLPTSTAADVFEKITEVVSAEKEDTGESSFDSTARILNYIPGIVLRFAVGFLNMLDYFGKLPRKLTKLSPFHGSMFITSMGSLNILPIYHHLYNFGNVPAFCAYGKKREENILQKDGTVETVKYIDMKCVVDERICDGHYYASAFKYLKEVLENPECLDSMPEYVVEDID